MSTSSTDDDAANQCDQVGQFLKILWNKISYKSSTNILLLWDILKNITFKVKTVVATFGATL